MMRVLTILVGVSPLFLAIRFMDGRARAIAVPILLACSGLVAFGACAGMGYALKAVSAPIERPYRG